MHTVSCRFIPVLPNLFPSQVLVVANMSPKKIITIFGATGLQGGSVAAEFLNDTALCAEWTVRAVTRDISKPSAKKLVEQGAQVVPVSNERRVGILEK